MKTKNKEKQLVSTMNVYSDGTYSYTIHGNTNELNNVPPVFTPNRWTEPRKVFSVDIFNIINNREKEIFWKQFVQDLNQMLFLK